MTLSKREKTIILVTNAIAFYSETMKDGSTLPGESVIDFVLKSIPDDLKSELSIELIDDVFSYITSSRMQLS